MGELFGLGQSQANEWIHTLLPMLKQALDDLGHEPERDPKKFKQSEQCQKDGRNAIIDQRIFIALVIMAMVTSMSSGPLMQKLIRRNKT